MKVDKLMEYRNEGMTFALKIVKEKGIEELEKEVKFRGLSYLPSTVNREKTISMLYEAQKCILDTTLLLALVVLRDEFGFGEKRANQFLDRFMLKTSCLQDVELTDLTWGDYQQQVKEELNLDIKIRWPEDKAS